MASTTCPTLPINLSAYPKLTPHQTGHLRHFHNLAAQLDGSWHHMGAQEPLQEFLDAYRYQLATMAYAAGAAHYHRQPLLRSVYKPLMRRLIHKMLLRDVWAYWFNTSLGGVRTDPGLKELRKPWADPIVRENIMYSGHLLLMVSLYAMLFDDDEFEKEGSMVFKWDPVFFGLGPEEFRYDTGSLQNAILREMERNGWVGVCCEPNMVFVVCNQFPMIGMRYNDIRHPTQPPTIPSLLPKYKAAWQHKGGMVRPNGLFPDAWLEKQDHVLSAADPGWTAWAAAFMTSWNSELLYELYERQAMGYLTRIGGEVRLQTPAVGNAFRALVEKEGAAVGSTETLEKAKAVAKKAEVPSFPYMKPMFGYVCQWLSELGKSSELEGLLAYADERLNPTWERGGLYYPRHDEVTDEVLEWTHMDPFSGNAAIGYARLNIGDGQKGMWEAPWTAEVLKSRPWVDGVSLADGVDFLRGVWDEQKKCVVLTMRAWDSGKRCVVRPVIKNLAMGEWDVWVGGQLKGREEVGEGGEIALEVEVGAEEVDVIIVGA